MNYTISTENSTGEFFTSDDEFLNEIKMMIEIAKLNNCDAVDISIHFEMNEKNQKRINIDTEKELLTVIKGIDEDIDLLFEAVSRGLSYGFYHIIKLDINDRILQVIPSSKQETRNYLFNRVKSIELMYKSED